MKKFCWKSRMNFIFKMLTTAGLWPEGETYHLNLYTLYAILSNLFFELIHFATQLIYLLKTTDFESVVQTIQVLNIHFLTMLKAYHIVRNTQTLKHLLNDTAEEMFRPKTAAQRTLAEDNLKIWVTAYIFLTVITYGTLFFWGIYPLFDANESEYRLPFLAWYPFDIKRSPVYEMVYIFQLVSCLFIIITNENADMMIAAFNVFTGTQFDFLCDDLRRLRLGEKESMSELVKCIKHHKNILRFTRTYNDFVEWIIVFQFVASAMTMSLGMFRLTVVVPFSNEFYSSLLFINAALGETFIYCWFGNDISAKGRNVPYAIFQSEWAAAPVDIQRNLIVFILRSQREVKIVALNFLELSLEAFVKILKTTYSFFALVQNISVKQ